MISAAVGRVLADGKGEQWRPIAGATGGVPGWWSHTVRGPIAPCQQRPRIVGLVRRLFEGIYEPHVDDDVGPTLRVKGDSLVLPHFRLLS